MPRRDGQTLRGRGRPRMGHRMHRRNRAARRIARLGHGRKGAGWGRWGVL
jgi:hypothetical protein